MKFLANFALNYWPDGTRIETKRSHSPTVEGKESEKRASVVGFARVLVESERVENSNLKNFLFFTFFFALFPKSFPFETYHNPKERAPTNPPRRDATRECKQKVRILPLFFPFAPRILLLSNHKKQPTNSFGSAEITISTSTRVYKTCAEEAQFSNVTRDTRLQRNDHRSGVTIIDGGDVVVVSGETEAR